MSDEQSERVIARALQEVSARRGVVDHAPEHQRGHWFLPIAVLMVIVLFVAMPAPMPQKLSWLMYGVCGLRPSNSYFAGDLQLPLEARLTGIYAGFTLATVLLLGLGRLGAQRLGSRIIITLIAFFFAAMVFDGVNSTFAELRMPHLYTPTNPLRLLTGLLAGIAFAPFVIWLLGAVAMPSTPDSKRPVLQSWWDVAVLVILALLFAVLVMQEADFLYYPIALISVIGVIGAIATAAFLVVLSINGQAGRVFRLYQAITPGALALLIAFGVLVGATALR